MTIISAVKNIVIPYGVLHSGKDGIVTSIEEKPSIDVIQNDSIIGDDERILSQKEDISVVYEKDNIAMGIVNIICAGSILTTNIRLGNFNIINIGCTISHDTELIEI